MSTKRSKKGFKRLQDHELADFTTLGNGGGPGDSGSESELLDLTTIDEHEGPGMCSSCCYWFLCLYIGLLTFVVVLLGVFGGYLAVNMWMMAQNATDVQSALEQKIATVEDNLSSFKKEMHHQFLSLQVSVSSLNYTVTKFYNGSSSNYTMTSDMLSGFEDTLKTLDQRLKVIESSPKETLMSQVDTTQKEMIILGQKLEMLNQSFEDLNGIKKGMAQLGSQLNHQNDQLTELGRSIGDMTKSNTDAQNDVANMADKIDEFESKLTETKNSISTSQEQLTQTSDLFSAKLTHLQTVVAELNDTLLDEVSSLWTNWTLTSTSLQTVQNELFLLKENITQLETTATHIPTSLKPVTMPPVTPEAPTTPVPTTAASTMVTGDENQNVPTTAPPPSTERESDEVTTSKPTEIAPEGLPTESVASTGNITTRSPSGEPVTSSTQSTESQSTGATEDQPLMGSSVNGTAGLGDNGTIGEGSEAGEAGEESETKQDLEEELSSTKQVVSVLQELLESFPDLDSNSDNKLTFTEFSPFIPESRTAAAKIFTALDSDQDLVITREEIRNNQQELEEKGEELKYKLSHLDDASEDGDAPTADKGVTTEEEKVEEKVDDEEDYLAKAREQLKQFMGNQPSR